MMAGRLAALALAALACGAAWGQRPGEPSGWGPLDASGKSAPMTFLEFHSKLTWDRAVEKLTAAGCKREEQEKAIFFACDAEPHRWFLTKPGTLEHPGLAVGVDLGNGKPVSGHTIMLGGVVVSDQTPERQEAFAVWTESLPIRRPMTPRVVDYDAGYKDGPLTAAQMKDVNLTFEQAVAALDGAAECKRSQVDVYVRYDCTTSRTRWYLTREGRPEHRGVVAMAPRSKVMDTRSVMNPEGYVTLTQKPFYDIPPGPGRRAQAEALFAWVATLPESVANRPPPLQVDFTGTPLTEKDLRPPTGVYVGAPPDYDVILGKLTAAGCPRKDVGDYLIFICKGSTAVFALSAPGAEVHPALLVGRIEPRYPNVLMVMARRLTKPGDPPRPQPDIAFSKWERGLGYLKVDELR